MAKKKKSQDKVKSDVKSFISKSASTAKSISTTVSGKRKSKKSKRFGSILTIALTMLFVAMSSLYYFDIPPFTFDLGEPFYKQYVVPSNNVEGVLRVHFIDVGQGDSILIQFPDGKNMLIDGGKNSNATAKKILDYIAPKTKTLDYLMLTHTDSDHCGSLDDVVSSDDILVKKVFMPKIKSNYANDPLKDMAVQSVGTKVYEDFVSDVVSEKSEIVYSFEGIKIDGVGYSLSMFSPNDELYSLDLNKGSIAQNRNNVSPICILEFNGKKILFTGDADEDAELSFINYTQAHSINTDVDIIKVGHHGGKESTKKALLNATKPEQAVISVGKNSYNHPTAETLGRLSDINCKVYRTDIKGNIVLTINNDKIGWFFQNDNIDYDSDCPYEEGTATSKLPMLRTNSNSLIRQIGSRS